MAALSLVKGGRLRRNNIRVPMSVERIEFIVKINKLLSSLQTNRAGTRQLLTWKGIAYNHTQFLKSLSAVYFLKKY